MDTHHNVCSEGKEPEKSLERNRKSMIDMKTGTLTHFGIPLETLTRHLIIGGRSGTGKSRPSAISFRLNKLNKEANYGTKKYSKRR